MSKRNLSPPKKNPEKEAEKFEAATSAGEKPKVKRKLRLRVGFKIPPKLKADLYAESNRTGRSVTDIVVEQLSKRYE